MSRLGVIKIQKGLTHVEAIRNSHSRSRGSDYFCTRAFLRGSSLLKVIHFDQTFEGKTLNMPHHRLGPMPGVGG